ncbi:hypothetical protein T458_17020 [Brevibacillus panacihumi W25]|uniref:Spore coat protein n=1 Tax=Brevibacillus panacihumi W25 TaxID=1408254 RepID=V6M200_9BACL|nr:hypothetical protein [Brevibacillus panacihumi]EST52661.1 hypothetical protein T458_17020 [Brevibacillus panacihumi W25]
MKTAKAGIKKNARSSKRSSRIIRAPSFTKGGKPRPFRIHVRAPKVHVTTPAPHLTVTPSTPAVQVEAPTVHVEAPKPLVIPAPIVKVEVEAEENPAVECIKALRKELSKCQKQNQKVELLFSADLGSQGRQYRIGHLIRVEEGIIVLRTLSTEERQGMTVLIPLNRIVAVIPDTPFS